MQPLESERRVIEAAEQLASTLGSNPDHTVAAAAMDTTGRIHTAVNVYHFTGGPCAELVALGVAATAAAGPLVAMAAAGDRERGLIPPCGRCRQVMLDQHPDLLVAVPGASGPEMRPVHELLPDAYRFPDAAGIRVLRFNERYADAVLSGEKTSTVRWGETATVGPALFYFEDSARPPAHGSVDRIDRCALSDLTAERLGLDEGADVGEHIAGLRRHYPAMPAEAEVDVLLFSLGRA